MSEVLIGAADLDQRALAAKESTDEMESLIKDFKPFLNARISKYCMAPDEDQREKLFSSAMMAFYESVKRYDIDRGHFFPFADRVVKSRIIDSLRSTNKHEENTVPLEEYDGEQPKAQTAALIELSIRSYDDRRRHELLLDEIEQFKAELSTWGISMKILSQNSPKHKRLLDTYREAVSLIAENADIVQTIQVKRYFPVKKISMLVGLPQKNVERARTFILASLIIKMGDYDFLSDYVKDRR